MPKPKAGESQKEFVSRCIPIVLDEGTAKDNKQAAAICYSMWRERDKGNALQMSVTLKTDPTNGRVRWKAIANSGEFDQQGDRFDESFFDDLVSNFWAVQDAVSRGEAAPPGFAHPEGMPVPQLDVAHYSFQLGRSDRLKARAGVPTFAYRDGRKMILQGHFDTSPLGQAASKSVLSDEADVIKTSIGVWPDWGNVEDLDDGRRIFKGGNQTAYLDHLALTAHPVDARTEIEAEGNQMAKSLTAADDALQVLGDENLVKELEAARAATKSEIPAGALVKATKTVDGKDYPASDFLVVEDSAQPSTWHLQVKENGKANHSLMAGAHAALLSEGGHRGNKYEGPGKSEAIKKLRTLYNSEDMEWPEEKKSEAASVAESVVTITHETTTKDVTTVEKDGKADAIDARNAEIMAQVTTATAPTAPVEPMMDSLAIARAISETRSVLSDALKALGERIEVLEKSTPNLDSINALATALNRTIEATQATEAQKVKAMLDNRGWLDIAKLYSARSATNNTVDGGERAKGPQEVMPQDIAGGPIAGRFLKT